MLGEATRGGRWREGMAREQIEVRERREMCLFRVINDCEEWKGKVNQNANADSMTGESGVVYVWMMRRK